MSRPTHTSSLVESKLQELLDIPLCLTLTDNTRSMITVRWKNGSCAVRLHQMFLDAAEDVWRALAAYIRRPSTRHKSLLKAFIQNHEAKIRPARTPIMPRIPRLHPEGKHVDLRGCFQRLNEIYFGGRNGCAITWGTRKRGRRPRTIRLGSYWPDKRIIRIHPVLDSPAVPAFVIEDVIYHEMLHHELGMVRANGRVLSHHRAFKVMEKAFPHSARAREWIKKNLSWLLTRAGSS
jgi:predicted SprT family Zn-dependent metalloprotease